MDQRQTIIYLENVLVKTLSGKPRPKGLWDYKINWPLWNALSNYSPDRVIIISNETWIKDGLFKASDYQIKMSFIASCLSEHLKLKRTSWTRISLSGDWLRYPGLPDCGEILDDIKGEIEFIGDESKFEYINSKFQNPNCITEEKFIEKYGYQNFKAGNS